MPGQDEIGREYEKNVLHKPGSQEGGSRPPFAQDFPALPFAQDFSPFHLLKTSPPPPFK